MKSLAATLLLIATCVTAIRIPHKKDWYADPEICIYDGVFWVFQTTSITFVSQSYFDAWSSPDLKHWTKHPKFLGTSEIEWAYDKLWAPCSISRNGKYYLYFSANGLRTSNLLAGIGVAIAD